MYPNNVINVFNFSFNEHKHYETFMIVNITISCYVIIMWILLISKYLKKLNLLGVPSHI